VTLPTLFRDVIERLVSGVGVRTVYGEPIQAGDRTIVPVARVGFGFGGGGGSHPRPGEDGDEGGGGGGGGSTRPVGVVEITPAGTRFVPIHDRRALAGAFAVGVLVGLLLRARCRR
jgi:uncharacterized spore protein YtfJ